MARLGQQSNRYRSWYLKQAQKKQPYYNTSALRVASRSYLGYSNQVLRGERGPEGIPGPQGSTGQSFKIKYTYNSLASLLAATPAEFPCFALVAGTLDEADDDYGKLYYYNDATSGWQFVADMSIQGIEGKHMLAGIGAPAATLGKEGDLYIDLNAKELYGPKLAVSGWGSPVSLKGDDGDPGTGGGTWTGDIDMNGYDITQVGEFKTSLLSLTGNIISNYGFNNSGGNIKINATEGVCSDNNYTNRLDCEANSANWVPAKSVIINNNVHISNYEDDAGGFGGVIMAGNSQDLQVGGQTNGDLLLNSLNYTKFYTQETYNFYNDDGSNEILRLDPSDGDGLQLSNATGNDVHLKTIDTTTDFTLQAQSGQLHLYGSGGVLIEPLFAHDSASAVKTSAGISTVTVSVSTADHTPGTYTLCGLVAYPNTLKGGQGAQATVVVAADGSITSVTVTEPGYNYDLGGLAKIATTTIGGTNAIVYVSALEPFLHEPDVSERLNTHDFFVPTINSVNQYITSERRSSRYDHLLVIPSDWMPADSSSTYNAGIYDWSSGTPGPSFGAVRPMSAYLELWAFKEIPRRFKATSIDIWINHKLATDSTELVVFEKFWDNSNPVQKGQAFMTGNAGYYMYTINFTDITATGDNMIALQLDPAATTTHILGAKIHIEEVL